MNYGSITTTMIIVTFMDWADCPASVSLQAAFHFFKKRKDKSKWIYNLKE